MSTSLTGAPLRIAVPNKGSLSESAVEMLREAGYRTRRDSKELVVTDTDNDVEFFYLRPRDIAVYVGTGTVDAGITGRDLLLDSGSPAVEVMPLGFGASTFRYASRAGAATTVADIAGQRVATSYPGLVRAHLDKAGVAADVVRLDGAVETAITLGVADVIADVVETGATLRSQGLEVFGDPILRSEAVLIGRGGPVGEDDGAGVTPGFGSCPAGSPGSSPHAPTSWSTTTARPSSSRRRAPSRRGSSRRPSRRSPTPRGARSARWSRAAGSTG